MCLSEAFRCVLTQYRGKTSAMILEKQLLLPSIWEGLYKVISKLCVVHHATERKIIHKWKIFKTAVNLPRSGCSSKFTTRNAQRNYKKKTRFTSQTLQASVSMLNVKVHDSTIRERLKYGFVN